MRLCLNLNVSFIYRPAGQATMTTADKFGIAFSIGFTVALIALALSFSATGKVTTTTPVIMTPPAPAPMPAPTPAPAPEKPMAAMSADVTIPSGSSTPGCETTNQCFTPNTVTVGVGGTVTWTNSDTAAHTVTSGTATNGPDGTFDSSIIMAGKTFSFTFDNAGTYDYFCVVHPWMTGKVIVE